MQHGRQWMIKVPVVLLLGNALYLAVKCPCKTMLHCHYEPFFLSIAGANFLLLVDAFV
jgi:hypothetical protein